MDAIAEFRILTQLAPPEYGGTGGATTTLVMRSGTKRVHSGVREFLRNDKLDARNFFSTKGLRDRFFNISGHSSIGGAMTGPRDSAPRFRADAFNSFNNPTFGLPVAEPRLIQFGRKPMF